MMELLNWYWLLLASIGLKMLSKAGAFLQQYRTNIHQYHFINPILFLLILILWFYKQINIYQSVLFWHVWNR